MLEQSLAKTPVTGIMITGRDPAAGEAFAAELAGNGTEVRFCAVDLADPLAAAGSVTGAVASYEIAEFLVFLRSDRSGVVTG